MDLFRIFEVRLNSKSSLTLFVTIPGYGVIVNMIFNPVQLLKNGKLPNRLVSFSQTVLAYVNSYTVLSSFFIGFYSVLFVYFIQYPQYDSCWPCSRHDYNSATAPEIARASCHKIQTR